MIQPAYNRALTTTDLIGIMQGKAQTQYPTPISALIAIVAANMARCNQVTLNGTVAQAITFTTPFDSGVGSSYQVFIFDLENGNVGVDTASIANKTVNGFTITSTTGGAVSYFAIPNM